MFRSVINQDRGIHMPVGNVMEEREIRSKRLKALPPYLFIEIDRKKRDRLAVGADVIDLGVGDPDRPTPCFVIESLGKAACEPVNHRYPLSIGMPAFRESAGRFMERRFGVSVDPAKNILTCIGSKDGIAHLPLAVVNPGEVVLCGSISYPVYRSGAIFAGAEIHEMPLTAGNGWIPELSEISTDVAKQASLMWVNYPNNPTAAVAPISFYEEAVRFCREYEIILASDNAYSEIYFDSADRPPSMWEATSAVGVDDFPGIEFHSLSKTFNMTGWRIGFAVGHPEVVSALAAVKGNCDSGQFGAIQAAGAVALDQTDHADVVAMLETYRERRDVFCAGMEEIGCRIEMPMVTFFVWGRCPDGWESFEFCERCLTEADVVLVPGGGFSESGRDYFRAALTVEVDRLREAVDRLKGIDWGRRS